MEAPALPPAAALDDHRCRTRRDRSFVNWVRIDATSPEDLLVAVEDFLQCGRSHVIHFLAAHPTTLARRDRGLRDLLNRGDLNAPDGMPVAWATRILGSPSPRVSGTDSFAQIVRWGVSRRLTHYLYGGAPQVPEQLSQQLKERYPGTQVVGLESPPFGRFGPRMLAEAAERIRAARTDALWVGLGSPKQDIVAERLRELDAAPLILCVGAAFDFIARVRNRAPAWMRRLGLEWVYRLGLETGRLWKR